mmetsp:Transcript_12468/g.36206  ORF Transcript_12468/g.36206 Transcript_12468/m.36206 type:complete len:404 (+) Transcript_12468:84-1295(+)
MARSDARDACEAQLWKVVRRNKPTEDDMNRHMAAYGKAREACEATFGYPPLLYGSAVSGFATRSSDLDLVLPLDDVGLGGRASFRTRVLEAIDRLRGPMERTGFNTEAVSGARVPILRCQWGLGTHTHMDISFGKECVVHNSRMLRTYAEFDHRVAGLGVLVKTWAKSRSLTDTRDGLPSPYAWLLLVIHFMQHEGILPILQAPPENICFKPYPKVFVDEPPMDVFFWQPSERRPNSAIFTPASGLRERLHEEADRSLALMQTQDLLCQPGAIMSTDEEQARRRAFGLQDEDAVMMGDIGDGLLALLYKFMHYYSCEYQYCRRNSGISVKRPSRQRREPYHPAGDSVVPTAAEHRDGLGNWGEKADWDRGCGMWIEDPFENGRNLGGVGRTDMMHPCTVPAIG